MKLFRLPIPAGVLALCLWFAGRTDAQDIHFTLHQMTPLAFNPANTGAFYGSYRLSGLYRDQYRTVTGKGAFMTPTFSVDLPIIRGFREKDWVGVGMFFYSDKSGDAGLTQSSFKASASYHFALNKKGTSVITLGYQTGGVQREIKDQGALVFESNLPGGNPGMEAISMDKKGFLDHVGGLRFSSKFNKTDEFTAGFAMGKFGRPDWSLLTQGGNYMIDPRMHIQIGMSSVMTDKLRFSPNITYQRIMGTPQNTLVAQGIFEYLSDAAKNTILIGGVGYRSGANIGDAAQLMVGAEIKGIRAMLGYDLNISKLGGASGTQGAMELAVQYIGRIYKRPKPDPIIFCPRF